MSLGAEPPVEGAAAAPLSAASLARVDALFAGEPEAPPQRAGPALRKIWALLALAAPFNLLGIPCGVGVPGGALTLWAYLAADAELGRVEDGLYGEEDALAVQRARSWAGWALVFCVVSFVLQVFLLMSEPYQAWLLRLLGALLALVAPLELQPAP